MPISKKQVILRITTSGKSFSRVNYSRRMYAIIRRYTPNVVEGETNECFADLTGLRTFLKMTYKEMAEKIAEDLTNEIGVAFVMRASTLDYFNNAKNRSRRSKSVSTYKEMNKLFGGKLFSLIRNRKSGSLKRKLTVPFLGKVA